MNIEDIYTLCTVRIGTSAIPDLVYQSVEEALETILNYINRKNIPDGAKWVWVSLACDMYRYYLKDMRLDETDNQTPDADGNIGLTLHNVSGIKIDDADVTDNITGIKYQADSTSYQTQKEVDFLKNYKARLQAFRKVRWIPVEGI